MNGKTRGWNLKTRSRGSFFRGHNYQKIFFASLAVLSTFILYLAGVSLTQNGFSDEISLTPLSHVFRQMDTIQVVYNTRNSYRKSIDWIGMYCPPSSGDHEYVDFAYVGPNAQGHVEFEHVVSFGFDCNFRYIRASGEKIATSKTIKRASGDNIPGQIHLARTEKDRQMRVHFQSYSQRRPIAELYSAPSSKSLIQRVKCHTRTYKAADMCHEPATITGPGHFINPGFQHDCVFGQLEPNKKYFYAVGHQGSQLSTILEFRTIKRSTKDMKQSFFIYGDSGSFMSSRRTLKYVKRDHEETPFLYSAIIHIGDLAYAFGNGIKWDQFGEAISTVANKIPYMVGIGNHEYVHDRGGENDPSGADGNGFHPAWGNYHKDSHGECAVPVVNRFQMPATGNGVFWYSFDVGNSHHIIVSSEHDYTPGSKMHKWLEKDLKAVDRSKTPWVILYSHRPMYCSEDYQDDFIVTVHQREAYEDLLHRYHVDVFFSGHYHAYERTCAVYQGTCIPDDSSGRTQSTIHVMVGSGGYEVDAAPYMEFSWSENAQKTWGYSRLHIENSTHAVVQFVRTSDGSVSDEKRIYTTHQW